MGSFRLVRPAPPVVRKRARPPAANESHSARTSGDASFCAGCNADAEFAQRGAAVVGVEDAELAAQGALVEDQARHDPDAAAEADQREDCFATGDLAVDDGTMRRRRNQRSALSRACPDAGSTTGKLAHGSGRW